jgi:branched-subunit amino acid transport protein
MDKLVWLIVAMGAVTYIPRMLPFVLLERWSLPPFLQGVLKNVPYAMLGALIVPGIFLVQDDPLFGVIGFVVAFLVAFLGANVTIVVLVTIIVLAGYTAW